MAGGLRDFRFIGSSGDFESAVDISGGIAGAVWYARRFVYVRRTFIVIVDATSSSRKSDEFFLVLI